MSDEIKKLEDEAPKAERSAELTERELDEVAGGNLHFVKTVDKASPVLMQACATGEHIKQ